MTTCQSPVAASALAAFSPSPEEAPVMMAVGFWVDLSVVAMAAGAAGAAVAAARTTTEERVEGAEEEEDAFAAAAALKALDEADPARRIAALEAISALVAWGMRQVGITQDICANSKNEVLPHMRKQCRKKEHHVGIQMRDDGDRADRGGRNANKWCLKIIFNVHLCFEMCGSEFQTKITRVPMCSCQRAMEKTEMAEVQRRLLKANLQFILGKYFEGNSWVQ